jgi:hypothetical protein
MSPDLSVFAEIAKNNMWGSQESVSGPGSTLASTESLRRGLEEYLPQLGIRTIVDAPCGDLNWIRHLRYSFDSFVGIDIVPHLIEKLKAQDVPRYHFQIGNIVTDILPRADALLCRDCLVHLPFEAIHRALRLWRLAGFRYIMSTTFTRHENNQDCRYGDWRRLNLQAAPFNLPEPMIVIPDNDHLPAPDDCKSLGIWKI